VIRSKGQRSRVTKDDDDDGVSAKKTY